MKRIRGPYLYGIYIKKLMRKKFKNSFRNLEMFCNKLISIRFFRHVDLMRAEGIKYNKGRGFIEFEKPD